MGLSRLNNVMTCFTFLQYQRHFFEAGTLCRHHQDLRLLDSRPVEGHHLQQVTLPRVLRSLGQVSQASERTEARSQAILTMHLAKPPQGRVMLWVKLL